MRTLKIFIEKIFYVAQCTQELSCKEASCVDGFCYLSNASPVSANQLTFFVDVTIKKKKKEEVCENQAGEVERKREEVNGRKIEFLLCAVSVLLPS